MSGIEKTDVSAASARLYACADSPCAECLDVNPRRAYPAPPHGDLRRPVDILVVGLNPQLRDYRIRCASCGHVDRVRHFEPTGWKATSAAALSCAKCSAAFFDDAVEFVRPSLADWTSEGLHLDDIGRSWINKRIDIDASSNVVNTRLCSWPSRDDGTICFAGARIGNHLLELITECQPCAVVAYNKQAASFLRVLAPKAQEQTKAFVTSGGKQTHVASWIEPGSFAGPGGSSFGLIFLSQAQTAPHSLADGVSMRLWAGELARRWVATCR